VGCDIGGSGGSLDPKTLADATRIDRHVPRRLHQLVQGGVGEPQGEDVLPDALVMPVITLEAVLTVARQDLRHQRRVRELLHDVDGQQGPRQQVLLHLEAHAVQQQQRERGDVRDGDFDHGQVDHLCGGVDVARDGRGAAWRGGRGAELQAEAAREERRVDGEHYGWRGGGVLLVGLGDGEDVGGHMGIAEDIHIESGAERFIKWRWLYIEVVAQSSGNWDLIWSMVG
jgi:hypothetical protein